MEVFWQIPITPTPFRVTRRQQLATNSLTSLACVNSTILLTLRAEIYIYICIYIYIYINILLLKKSKLKSFIPDVATKSAQHAHARMTTTVVEKVQTEISSNHPRMFVLSTLCGNVDKHNPFDIYVCVWEKKGVCACLEREKGCVCLSGFLHHSFSLKWSTGLSELIQMLVVNNKILKQLLSTLQWRNNERDGVSNHQPHGCLLHRLFRCRSKKTSKLRVTGLYEGSSPVTGEFPTQRASNAGNVSIWWRHHEP